MKEELEAARAAPPRLNEADAQGYQQERFRLFRAQIEADLGIARAEIERIRRAYVALLPVDPEARRAELEALKRELHLDDLDPTPATKRRQAPKNRRPMESWLSRLSQSGAKLESATAQPATLVWKRDGMYHRAKAGLGHYLVGPTETLDGGPFNVMHFSAGEVIAEERRDLGTAKSLKAAKAIAMSDWEKRNSHRRVADDARSQVQLPALFDRADDQKTRRVMLDPGPS